MHWEKVVGMIQATFSEGHLIEECTWNTVFLIPKGDGNSLGIGLVEVMWKIVMGILKRRLMA